MSNAFQGADLLAEAIDDGFAGRLSPEEAWAVVEASHTGIFTSLRRDGVPIALPARRY